MNLKVKKVEAIDNIVEYSDGYTAGSYKATNDFREGKKNINCKQNNEYNKGYSDGYNYTYQKCSDNNKLIEDDLTKLLKNCLSN